MSPALTRRLATLRALIAAGHRPDHRELLLELDAVTYLLATEGHVVPDWLRCWSDAQNSDADLEAFFDNVPL